MKMKSILKIVPLALIIVAIAVPSLSCSSQSSNAAAIDNQVTAVQRGNLTLDITAAGNLALSRTEDMAFEIAGTVEDILVGEGDNVKAGQVLAKLDTSAWDDQVATLESQLTASQRQLTAKQRAVTSAEHQVTVLERQVIAKESAVTTAENQVAAKELAVRQAQLDLQTAEDNLSKTADVKKAQDAVDNAEYALKFAKSMMAGEFGGAVQLSDYTYWSQLAANAKDQLTEAQKDLQDILSGTSITLSSDVALQVAKSQLTVEKSQMAVGDAQTAVDTAKQAVKDAQLAVDDANYAVDNAQIALEDARTTVGDTQEDVEKAQKALDEVRSASPQIVAPFDGFVTTVSAKGGDEVKKGTIAMQIADPTKFQADILVSEMDIQQIKLEGDAAVQVTAMTGMSLPAKVTHISPTATIQSGVVNYKITVEVQSLEAAIQQRQQASGNVSSDNVTSGSFRQRAAGALSGQSSTGTTQSFQLRQGLTVTVSIIVQQKTGVLLVPNAAITRQGTKSLVKVSKGSVTEDREVKTGISNWQYTEITGGLNEGEQVVVPKGTTTTSTAQQQGQPGGGMFMPGVRVR